MENIKKTAPPSLSDKKKQLRDLRRQVMELNMPPGIGHQQIVATLAGCFSSDPEAILLSSEILGVLMECDSFVALSINVFRRLFRYLPFFFQSREDIHRERVKTIQLLTQCLERFHQKCHLIGQRVSDFPFTMLFHLVMLISEQIGEMNGQEQHVIELILQTLNVAQHMTPKARGTADLKILRKIITAGCSLIRAYCNNLMTKCSYLSKLALSLMQVFIIPNPDQRYYWMEHRIITIYGIIFDIYVCELPQNPEIIESLLDIVNNMLQQELELGLKLSIIEQLLDRGNGLAESIKMLYRYVTDKIFPFEATTFNDVVTVILSHYVWQFEYGTENEAFVDLKIMIYGIVLGVNWPEVMTSNFEICYLSVQATSASNLWLILLVTYFETVHNEWNCDSVRCTSLMMNINTLLKICSLKHYTIPKFLKKYVLEAIAKFNDHNMLNPYGAELEEHLRQLVAIDGSQNIFGLLPATVPRLKWFKQCGLRWKAEFIRRQRVEALEERLFSPSIIDAHLLDYFPVELLISVLSNSTNMNAQSNASTILSRVLLPNMILERIVDKKLTIGRHSAHDKWYQYLRAIFSSLVLLNESQRDQITLFLNEKLHSGSINITQTILVIDCLTRIIIAKNNTIEISNKTWISS